MAATLVPLRKHRRAVPGEAARVPSGDGRPLWRVALAPTGCVLAVCFNFDVECQSLSVPKAILYRSATSCRLTTGTSGGPRTAPDGFRRPQVASDGLRRPQTASPGGLRRPPGGPGRSVCQYILYAPRPKKRKEKREGRQKGEGQMDFVQAELSVSGAVQPRFASIPSAPAPHKSLLFSRRRVQTGQFWCRPGAVGARGCVGAALEGRSGTVWRPSGGRLEAVPGTALEGRSGDRSGAVPGPYGGRSGDRSGAVPGTALEGRSGAVWRPSGGRSGDRSGGPFRGRLEAVWRPFRGPLWSRSGDRSGGRLEAVPGTALWRGETAGGGRAPPSPP
jgi:hypothetical protein